jgi:hypothetical protein
MPTVQFPVEANKNVEMKGHVMLDLKVQDLIVISRVMYISKSYMPDDVKEKPTRLYKTPENMVVTKAIKIRRRRLQREREVIYRL